MIWGDSGRIEAYFADGFGCPRLRSHNRRWSDTGC